MLAGMTPIMIGQARWGLTCLVMFLALQVPSVAKLTRCVWPGRRDAVLAVFYGVCFLGPAHVLYYTALTESSTVVGNVLNTTAPLWVAVFSLVILAERLTPARTAAIVLGVIGAYMVSIGFKLPQLSAGDTASNLRYLIATVSECLGGVLAIRLVRRNSGISILAFEMVGALIVFLIVPAFGAKSLAIDWAHGVNLVSATCIAYLVLIPGLLCWGAWYVIAERSPINTMIVSTLVQPVAGAVIAFFWTHEPLTTPILVGSVVILSALLVAAGASSLRENVARAQDNKADQG